MNNFNNKIVNRKAKNFTVYNQANDISGYDQYLCKFKDEITDEEFLDFCSRVDSNEHLPKDMSSVFKEIASSDVVNFKKYFDKLKECDSNIEEITNVTVEFLEMFNFGNKRYKSSHRFGMDYLCALKATFGNVKKDRRLLREYQSALPNSALLEFVSFNIDEHYIGNVKDKKAVKVKK